jgi:KipI family sensor histidine kinase inhibitor
MSDGAPVVSLLGDTAIVMRTGGVHRAVRLAAAFREVAMEGVEDVVGADSSLGVVFDPDVADPVEILAELSRLAAGLPTEAALSAGAGSGRSGRRREHEVGVRFDGEDLTVVADRLGSDPGAIVRRLVALRLEVGFVGFLPGFAYLLGLPPDLAAVGRLARPRARVEPGSVAVGGGYAGIYPSASPGGWFLLGRTDFAVFDPEEAPYALLSPGDTVRFVPLDDSETKSTAGTGRPPGPSRLQLRTTEARALEILSPGGLATVQDEGRIGVAHLGVPRAGAFDLPLLEVANLAVGNHPHAAALELAGTGFSARCRGSATIALASSGSSDLVVDGRSLPPGAIVPLSDGAVVELRVKAGGARAYLAVAGGLRSPVWLGSASTDLSSSVGPAQLKRGDELALGTPGRARGRLFCPARGGGPARLRVVGDEATLSRLGGRRFQVDRASDRTGVRLVAAGDLAAAGDHAAAGELADGGAGSHRPARNGTRSQLMVTGAVQLPEAGRPIALGPDHGTLGGYEVACTVVSTDIGVLGQLLPGDEVEFEPVSLGEAAAARRARAAAVRQAVSGWFPSTPA